MRENTDQNKSEYGHFLPNERVSWTSLIDVKNYITVCACFVHVYGILLENTKNSSQNF